MPTQEQIAAATLAQLFGSELYRVDQTTINSSNSTPNAVRIDPKSFLSQTGDIQKQQRLHESQLIEALNREAEMAYPRPEIPSPPQIKQELAPVIAPSSPAPTAILPETEDVFSKINCNLERIATALEKMVKFDKKEKRSILKHT
jgi:hypothetical protein